jgi:hypothetical protein
MSSRTYICTRCRTSRRAPAAYGLNTELRCSVCSGPLWELEWRWRIPRKTDDKAWRELEAKVAHDASVILPRRHRRGMAIVQKLDRQIETTSRQKDSVAKAKRLKKLQHERAQAIHDYV